MVTHGRSRSAMAAAVCSTRPVFRSAAELILAMLRLRSRDALQKLISLLRRHLPGILAVGHDDRPQCARAQAVDRLQREQPVARGASGPDAQLGLQSVEHLWAAAHVAGRAHAHVQAVFAFWLEAEGVIKR